MKSSCVLISLPVDSGIVKVIHLYLNSILSNMDLMNIKVKGCKLCHTERDLTNIKVKGFKLCHTQRDLMNIKVKGFKLCHTQRDLMNSKKKRI